MRRRMVEAAARDGKNHSTLPKNDINAFGVFLKEVLHEMHKIESKSRVSQQQKIVGAEDMVSEDQYYESIALSVPDDATPISGLDGDLIRHAAEALLAFRSQRAAQRRLQLTAADAIELQEKSSGAVVQKTACGLDLEMPRSIAKRDTSIASILRKPGPKGQFGADLGRLYRSLPPSLKERLRCKAKTMNEDRRRASLRSMVEDTELVDDPDVAQL